MVMFRLDLEKDQAEVLRDVLCSYLGDLRMEIAGTDNYDFRQELKGTEVLLKELIARLGGPVAVR